MFHRKSGPKASRLVIIRTGDVNVIKENWFERLSMINTTTLGEDKAVVLSRS
jgi:hypothetical protein